MSKIQVKPLVISLLISICMVTITLVRSFLTTKEFYKIDTRAGKLMISYLVWLTFAAYLNLAIALHYL